jgi:broad specificity phosphatase PhoE
MSIRPVLVALALAPVAWPATASAQKAVYLVRHAHRTGEELDETGIAQAATLACLLKDSGITAIYISDVPRTRNTAEPLRALLVAQGVDVKVHEILLGELAANAENARNRTLQDDYAKKVLDHVAANHPGEIILIVGHDNTVPAVIRKLKYPLEVTIGRTEFDHLFQVIPRGDGRAPGFLHIQHYAN